MESQIPKPVSHASELSVFDLRRRLGKLDLDQLMRNGILVDDLCDRFRKIRVENVLS